MDTDSLNGLINLNTEGTIFEERDRAMDNFSMPIIRVSQEDTGCQGSYMVKVSTQIITKK